MNSIFYNLCAQTVLFYINCFRFATSELAEFDIVVEIILYVKTTTKLTSGIVEFYTI